MEHILISGLNFELRTSAILQANIESIDESDVNGFSLDNNDYRQ